MGAHFAILPSSACGCLIFMINSFFFPNGPYMTKCTFSAKSRRGCLLIGTNGPPQHAARQHYDIPRFKGILDTYSGVHEPRTGKHRGAVHWRPIRHALYSSPYDRTDISFEVHEDMTQAGSDKITYITGDSLMLFVGRSCEA